MEIITFWGHHIYYLSYIPDLKTLNIAKILMLKPYGMKPVFSEVLMCA